MYMISIIYERSCARCSVLEACRLRFSGGPPQLASLAQAKEKLPFHKAPQRTTYNTQHTIHNTEHRTQLGVYMHTSTVTPAHHAL